jgi:hypothetical protein
LLRAWGAWHVPGHLVGEQPYADARPTLAWAKEAGYRLGLVTKPFLTRRASCSATQRGAPPNPISFPSGSR